jgi:hypothetical protein
MHLLSYVEVEHTRPLRYHSLFQGSQHRKRQCDVDLKDASLPTTNFRSSQHALLEFCLAVYTWSVRPYLPFRALQL